MTNEEKAREIGRTIGIHTDAYLGAMEMAQWKWRNGKINN